LKKRVLIMSGTILNNDILALEAAGLEVETAQNYPEGVEKLDETSPDLVIIDEMLPVVNGREACSRLRQMSDIPIILLSADRSGQAVARAINQGVDTYIFKPFSSRELEARVNALLRRYQRRVMVLAEVEKEQGPIFDLIDKITDKETSLNINIEDIGGRLFGRSLSLSGRLKIGLGTLRKAG